MIRNKIRVLHIFSGYGGGIGTLVKNLISNKSDDCIFDAMAFSFELGPDFVELVEAQGGECITLPRIRRDGLVTFLKSVRKNLLSEKYDIVHCHLSGISALPFFYYAKRNRIKNVLVHAHATTHDSWWDRIPLFYSVGKYLNFKYSSYYLTCSDIAADYVYGEEYLRKRQALLVANGIDEDKYKVKLEQKQIEAYRKEFGIDRELCLINVGRFNRQKNHEFLIRIAKQLADNNISFKLLLVGIGEMQEEIRRYVKQLNLVNQVLFLNRRSDVNALMQMADCFILPSLYEGLPTVAIEAQASGLPIIMADTISRQSDMGIGLATFLPIDENDICKWVERIHKNTERLDIEYCIEEIGKKGFTAKQSSKNYCTFLNSIHNKKG